MEQEDHNEDSSTIRRPMNAFLIFCKRHRSVVRAKNPNLDNRSITRILGDLWAKLDPKEKSRFTELAKKYKDHFMKANPDFRWYNPEKSTHGIATRPMTRPSSARISNRSAPTSLSAETPDLDSKLLCEKTNKHIAPVVKDSARTDKVSQSDTSIDTDTAVAFADLDSHSQSASQLQLGNSSSADVHKMAAEAMRQEVTQHMSQMSSDSNGANTVTSINIVDHVIDNIYSQGTGLPSTSAHSAGLCANVESSRERFSQMQLISEYGDSIEDLTEEEQQQEATMEEEDDILEDCDLTKMADRKLSDQSLHASPDMVREGHHLYDRSDDDHSSRDSIAEDPYNKFRKRAFSDAYNNPQGRKTVEFDLEEQIAHLPTCHIDDLSKRRNTFKSSNSRRRHHSDGITRSSSVRRRHHSEGSKRQLLTSSGLSEFKAPPKNWVPISGRVSAELLRTRNSPSPRVSPSPPLVGSQRRKARKLPITHKIPISSPTTLTPSSPLDLKQFVPPQGSVFRPLHDDADKAPTESYAEKDGSMSSTMTNSPTPTTSSAVQTPGGASGIVSCQS